MKCTEHPLRQILELTKDQWDHPGERDAVRDNFPKVCMCRTAALGGEVYASAAAEKVCYHTCKSKCCPGCGNRGTLLWQREQWATLPDIAFVGIVLTMPDVFWPVFKAHRHLQHNLPAPVQPYSSSGRGADTGYACAGSSYNTPSEGVSTITRIST
jgi:hypothetical protein